MMTKEILFLCLLAGNACLVSSAAFDSIFTDLDSNIEKIKEGISCTKNESDSTVFTFAFRTVEIDQAGGFFNYTQMSLMLMEAIRANNKTEANQTGCGVEEFGPTMNLWKTEFPVTIADANPPCGGEKVGTMFTFAIRAQIHPSFDSRADAIFLAGCNTSDLTQTTLNIQEANPLQVGDIAIVHKVVNYNAKMVLIQGGSALDWDADTIITGPVNLGDAFRLRVDFEITHPDNRTEFDKNGFGPIAAYPHTCTFSRDTSQEIDKGDPDTLLNTQEVIKDGCGTGEYAAFTLAGLHGFEAHPSPTKDGDNWWERSPNSMYTSKEISAVAFMGSKIQLPGDPAFRKTNITCYLKYCKTFSDSRCFGNGTVGQGYKDCSGTRRRRDTVDEDDDFYEGDEDLPTEVSTILTIRLNPDAVSDRNTDEPCFETTTFYALTAVLVVLLVAVLIIAAFLACKLRGVMRDIDSSQGSRTGIHNKGYYQ